MRSKTEQIMNIEELRMKIFNFDKDIQSRAEKLIITIKLTYLNKGSIELLISFLLKYVWQHNLLFKNHTVTFMKL